MLFAVQSSSEWVRQRRVATHQHGVEQFVPLTSKTDLIDAEQDLYPAQRGHHVQIIAGGKFTHQEHYVRRSILACRCSCNVSLFMNALKVLFKIISTSKVPFMQHHAKQKRIYPNSVRNRKVIFTSALLSFPTPCIPKSTLMDGDSHKQDCLWHGRLKRDG